MSDPAADNTSFRQLQLLVRGLGEELGSFRRRAQVAESRVRTLEAALSEGGEVVSLERVRALEEENAELKARLAVATDRARTLLARVRFMRQQHTRPGQPGGPARLG